MQLTKCNLYANKAKAWPYGSPPQNKTNSMAWPYGSPPLHYSGEALRLTAFTLNYHKHKHWRGPTAHRHYIIQAWPYGSPPLETYKALAWPYGSPPLNNAGVALRLTAFRQ